MLPVLVLVSMAKIRIRKAILAENYGKSRDKEAKRLNEWVLNCKKAVKIHMQFNDQSHSKIFLNLLILEEIC